MSFWYRAEEVFVRYQAVTIECWVVRTWKLICVTDSVQFSRSVVSNSLQHTVNCGTPGLPVHHQLLEFTQTQRPLSRWCHPAISASVVPFSFCPQSLPASESFPMSRLFTWGSQSTGFLNQFPDHNPEIISSLCRHCHHKGWRHSLRIRARLVACVQCQISGHLCQSSKVLIRQSVCKCSL